MGIIIMIIDNYEFEQVKCSWDIKIKISLFEEISFNKDELKKSFTNINNLMNLNVMKYYKIIFKKNNIINNFGFYFMSIIIVLLFIFLIIFKYELYLKIIILLLWYTFIKLDKSSFSTFSKVINYHIKY